MQPFSTDGVFWIHGHDDDQVAGQVSFDPERGTELRLIGSFEKAPDLGQEDTQQLRIDGVGGRKFISLLRARRTSSQIEMPGIRREGYHADWLLAGADLTDDKELLFDGGGIELTNLAAWIRRTGITAREVQEPDRGWVGHDIGFRRLPPEETPIPGGRLTLGFTAGFTGDTITDAAVNNRPYFDVRFDRPAPLNEVTERLGLLRDLVTIATDAPSEITSMSLYHPSHAHTFKGRVGYDSVEAHARYSGDPSHADEKPVESHNMWFTFEDAGGLSTIAKWLELSDELRSVIGSLLSVRYTRRMYAESRLQNVCAAAETLHRLRFPNYLRPVEEFEAARAEALATVAAKHRDWVDTALKYSNHPRLRQRLVALARSLGDLAPPLVGGDIKAWARVVSDLRNQITHRDESRGDRESGDLYFLAESVYVVTALAVLRQVGVTERALSGVAGRNRISFLTEKMSEIIPRLVQQTRH